MYFSKKSKDFNSIFSIILFELFVFQLDLDFELESHVLLMISSSFLFSIYFLHKQFLLIPIPVAIFLFLPQLIVDTYFIFIYYRCLCGLFLSLFVYLCLFIYVCLFMYVFLFLFHYIAAGSQ